MWVVIWICIYITDMNNTSYYNKLPTAAAVSTIIYNKSWLYVARVMSMLAVWRMPF